MSYSRWANLLKKITTDAVNPTTYNKYTGFDSSYDNTDTDPYQTTLSNTRSKQVKDGTGTSRWSKLLGTSTVEGQNDIPLDANFFRNQDTDTIIKQLKNAGIEVPDNPLEKTKETKPAWWMRVLNKLALPGYLTEGAIYNAIDDNPNTTAWQGVKNGWNAGWNNSGEGKSGNDILNVLQNSTNSSKQTTGNLLRNVLSLGLNKADNKYVKGVGNFVSGLAVDLVTDPTTFIDAPVSSMLKGSKAAKGVAGHLDDIAKVVDETADIAKSVDPAFDAAKRAESLLRQVDDFNNIARKGKGGITFGVGKFRHELVSEQAVRDLSDKLGISTLTGGLTSGVGKLLHSNPVTGSIADTVGKLGVGIQKKFTPYELKQIAKENPEMAARVINSQTLGRQLKNSYNMDKDVITNAGIGLKDTLGTEDKSKALTDLIENLQTGYSEAYKGQEDEIRQKVTSELQNQLDTYTAERDRILKDNTHINPKKIQLDKQIDKLTKLQDLLNKQEINPIEKVVDLSDVNKQRADDYLKRQFNKSTKQTDIPDVLQNIIPEAETEIPKEQMVGKAVWKNKDVDQPVEVEKYLGNIGGKDYVKIKGSDTGIPLEEIQFDKSTTKTTPVYKNVSEVPYDDKKIQELTDGFYSGKGARPTDENYTQTYNAIREGYQSSVMKYGEDTTNKFTSGQLLQMGKESNPDTAARFTAQKQIEQIMKDKTELVKDGKETTKWTGIKQDLRDLRPYANKEDTKEAYKQFLADRLSKNSKLSPEKIQKVMDLKSAEIDKLPETSDIYQLYKNHLASQLNGSAGDTTKNVVDTAFDNTTKPSYAGNLTEDGSEKLIKDTSKPATEIEGTPENNALKKLLNIFNNNSEYGDEVTKQSDVNDFLNKLGIENTPEKKAAEDVVPGNPKGYIAKDADVLNTTNGAKVPEGEVVRAEGKTTVNDAMDKLYDKLDIAEKTGNKVNKATDNVDTLDKFMNKVVPEANKNATEATVDATKPITTKATPEEILGKATEGKKYSSQETKALKEMQGAPLNSEQKKGLVDLLKKAGVDDVYRNVDKLYIGQGNIAKWKRTLNDIINSDGTMKISLDKAGKSMPEIIKNVNSKVKLQDGISQMKDFFPEEYDTLMNKLKAGDKIDLSSMNASQKIKDLINERLEAKRTMLQTVEPMVTDNTKSLEQVTKQIDETLNNQKYLSNNFRDLYHKLHPEDPNWNRVDTEKIVKKTVDERVKQLPDEFKEAGRKFMTDMDEWMKSEEFWKVLDKERENYVPHIPTMESRTIEGQATGAATPVQKIIEDKLNLMNPDFQFNKARTMQGTIKEINEKTAKGTLKENLWSKYADDMIAKVESQGEKIEDKIGLKKQIIASMPDYHIEKYMENDAVKLYLERGLKHSQALYDARYNDLMLKSFGVQMNIKEMNGNLIKRLTDLSPMLKKEELIDMIPQYKEANRIIFDAEKKHGKVSMDEYRNAKDVMQKIYMKFEDGQIDDETLTKLFEKGKERDYGFYNGFAGDYIDKHKAAYSGGYNSDPLKSKVNSALGVNRKVDVSESLPKAIREQIKNSQIETPTSQMMRKLGTGEYVLVYPQGISKEQEISKIADKEVPEIMKRNVQINQLADAKGQITPQVLVKVDLDQIEKLKVQGFDVPMYAMPKGAYDQVKMVVEDQMKRDKDAFLQLYDKFSNVWKANATLSTGFHVRNAFTNTLQNFFNVGIQAFNPEIHKDAVNILRNGDGAVKAGGKTYTVDEFKKIATLNGVLGTEQLDYEIRDFMKNISKEGFSEEVFKNLPQDAQKSILNKIDTNDMLRKTKLSDKLNPLNIKDNALYNASRKVGNTIEDEAKLVNFIANLNNGLSVEESADNVRKYLFDYSDLTPFERDTMKRIIPFYTWMRKNIPLQLDNLMNRQSVFRIGQKIQNNMNQQMEGNDKSFLPEFTKGYINLGKNSDGTYKLLNTNYPWQDLSKITDVKEMASSINPLVKLLMEEGFNKNMYFNTPIDSGSGSLTEAPWFVGGKDNPILKALGGGVNASTGKTMLPARLNYALTSLLPQLRTLGAYADGMKSGDNSKLMGLNTYNFDVDRQKNTAQNDYLKELQALQMKLKSLGIDISQITKDKIASEKEEKSGVYWGNKSSSKWKKLLNQ